MWWSTDVLHYNQPIWCVFNTKTGKLVKVYTDQFYGHARTFAGKKPHYELKRMVTAYVP